MMEVETKVGNRTDDDAEGDGGIPGRVPGRCSMVAILSLSVGRPTHLEVNML